MQTADIHVIAARMFFLPYLQGLGFSEISPQGFNRFHGQGFRLFCYYSRTGLQRPSL